MNRKKAIRLPPLFDHHTHPSLYVAAFDCLDLKEVTDKNRALELLHSLPYDKVSLVFGYHSGYYQFSAKELNPCPPLVINDISLHDIILTPKAAAILKDRHEEIVLNHKDSAWKEKNSERLLSFIFKFATITPAKITRFFDHLTQLGVYEVEDMHLVNTGFLDLIQDSPYKDRVTFWSSAEFYQELDPKRQKLIKGIKLFLDGAIGARTAATSFSYPDPTKAPLHYSDQRLLEKLESIMGYEKPVAIHALGDIAIEQAVRVANDLAKSGYDPSSIRIEHAEFITEAQAYRVKELGITLSMQPNFTLDSIFYKDRIPSPSLAAINPFRMLMDKAGFIPGKDLILGSDGMPHGIFEATNSSFNPPYPSQRLTLAEFKAAYCTNRNPTNHYIEFIEKIGGFDIKVITT